MPHSTGFKVQTLLQVRNILTRREWEDAHGLSIPVLTRRAALLAVCQARFDVNTAAHVTIGRDLYRIMKAASVRWVLLYCYILHLIRNPKRRLRATILCTTVHMINLEPVHVVVSSTVRLQHATLTVASEGKLVINCGCGAQNISMSPFF